ncbi:MAG: F0F1 ATP synthase subunit delta [Paenibacillaceae bacterium]
MSSHQTVAKRYAKALFEIASQQNITSEVEEQLKALVTAIQENIDFEKFLHHPNIAVSAKMDAVKNGFKGGLSDAVANTLQLLLERGREASIAALSEGFVRIANEALGRANAIVSSPYLLSDKETEEITKFFSKLTGKNIRLEQQLDTSLLGGIQVRIGDRLYDGSLKSKLANMQKTLLNSQAL